jgi:2-polyprenyl-6-methoxyphenol hydroxylase-like FAD-dependent oxidoreductase
MDSEPRIVIVGAGPTGLTLACQLWRWGVPCRVIDQELEPTSRSRAIGMSARSLEVFDEFGAAQDVVGRGVECHGATFYSSGRRIGRMTFSSAKHTKYPFMLALPQSDTESVLTRHLKRLGGTVERGVRLRELDRQAEQVSLTLDGPGGPETVTADWVVGADGAHSAVRRLSGIGFSGKATDDVFVSVDAFVTDGPAHGDGHYYFFPGGLAVIVGLPDGSHRLTALVRTAERDDADLDARDIEALIRRGTGKDLGVRELRNAGWGIARVRIHSRVADSFRAGRCLLAGDAAHVFGPVGGQGMNSGIQDAQNLAWKLALVSTGRADAALLDSYQAERRPVALHAKQHASQQAMLATVRPKAAVAVRDTLFGGMAKAGVVDRVIGPSVTQLALAYSGRKRIPNTRVGDGTLYELLRDRMFTVLVFGVESSALAGELREQFHDLVAVQEISRSADQEGRLHKHLRVTSPTTCLVRPDGHIAYQGSPSGVITHLRHILDGR